MPREKIPTNETAAKRAPRKPSVKAAVKKATAAPPEATSFTPFVDPERRSALIAEAAYYRAEKRGFAPGGDAEDWLAAESEVDARLLRAASAPRV
ncbi:MAG TPA: DUF2934 domain-containing protein [Steroidobacteraceae bacterium]|nr:DUF2934 domain-containing protein [Steroidobacteraceae bacterium]